MRKVLLAMLLFLLSATGRTQAVGVNGWHLIKAEILIRNKGRVVLEDQVRSQHLFRGYNFHAYTAAAGYRVRKNTFLSVGGGRFCNYRPNGNFKSPLQNDESRLFEQLDISNSFGRLLLEQRYRVEQRWMSHGYQNRYRARLMGSMCFNKATLEKGAVYAFASDEFFFSDQLPRCVQNRLQAGCGYQVGSCTRFVLAWVRQSGYLQGKPTLKTNMLQTTFALRLKWASS